MASLRESQKETLFQMLYKSETEGKGKGKGKGIIIICIQIVTDW